MSLKVRLRSSKSHLAQVAQPGAKRQFYLPSAQRPAPSALLPHHRHHYYTTLHPPTALVQRADLWTSAPLPDSPLFTRLFQIGQNVKPKNGTQVVGQKTSGGGLKTV